MEIFSFGRSLSRTSTPLGSRHLAVSNDRLPDSVHESLLMLKVSHRLAEASCQIFPKKPTQIFPRRFLLRGEISGDWQATFDLL